MPHPVVRLWRGCRPDRDVQRSRYQRSMDPASGLQHGVRASIIVGGAAASPPGFSPHDREKQVLANERGVKGRWVNSQAVPFISGRLLCVQWSSLFCKHFAFFSVEGALRVPTLPDWLLSKLPQVNQLHRMCHRLVSRHGRQYILQTVSKQYLHDGHSEPISAFLQVQCWLCAHRGPRPTIISWCGLDEQHAPSVRLPHNPCLFHRSASAEFWCWSLLLILRDRQVQKLGHARVRAMPFH